MTEAGTEKPQQDHARCPYCGCGFVPAQPDQVYCSPFCEQQDALEKGRRPKPG
jgi:hypothetical protein